MVKAMPCPDRAQLDRFLRADLPEAEVLGVESHLELCDLCAASIHEISSQDPLLNALRDGAPESAEPVADALAERLCRALPGLLAPGHPPETVDGSHASHTRAIGDTEELFDFLAPPEGPGEIGRLGPYRVIEPIGAGGMGIVFRAEDPILKRPVALKVMKQSLSASPNARRRFIREAQTVAALEHDHVVSIYQAGEDRGILFLAMPLLQGETLADRLAREEILPLSDALQIAREAAQGLDAAHSRGLVHRDIKPSNIWLDAHRGRVKILDFGLSKSLEEGIEQTQLGQITGTPHYMSPEQARGAAVTPLCDLFSLGCVLYRMTTGRVPFDGPDTLAVLTSLAVTTPERPERLNPTLPANVSALIMTLLAREPVGRPASARAVVESIETIERNYRVKPRSRRRSAIGLALTAILGVSIAGAAFGPQIIRILGDKGQLVIETSDPEVRVEISQGGKLVAIVDSATGRKVDLRAGDYEVELSEGKDGLRLSTRRFVLARGGHEVVRVTMEPPARKGAAVAASLDAAALHAKAEASTRAGDIDRAISDWGRVIAIEPTWSRLHARGQVYLQKRDFDRALADFREASRLAPKESAPHTAAGLVYRKRGDFERARTEYDEASRLDPKSATAFRTRGRFFLDRRELDRALADFDEAIRLDPRDAAAFEARSQAREAAGDHLGAIADSDTAQRFDPNRTDVYANRGAAFVNLGEWSRGRAELDEFIRRVPREPWSHYHRAVSRQNLGDRDGAIVDFNIALELEPENALFHGQRGLVFAFQHDLNRALADVEKALKSSPNDRELLRLRAWVRAQLGEYKGALADYNRAFEGRPFDATKLADKASTEALAGDYKAAEVDFEAALRLAPTSAWIRARRARYLHAGRGDHKRAIAECDEALRLNPGNAEASLYRGLSFLALGDSRRAIADFERALDPSRGRDITFLGPMSSHYPDAYRARSQAREALGDAAGAKLDREAFERRSKQTKK